MELESIDDTFLIRRHSLTDGLIGPEQSVLCPPRFSGDFPPGALRRELRSLLDVRPLLPVAETCSLVETFNIRDQRGKETLRLVIDRAERVSNADSVPAPVLYLESDVQLEALHNKIAGRIAAQFTIHRLPLPLMTTAMQSNGNKPGSRTDYHVDLTPQMRADVALRTILLRLFAMLRANEEGVVSDLGAEYLHDYRVAIRRTRSIVGRVKGVITERRRLQLVEDLRWLGEITGPSRDMDVYLMNFSDLQEQLPEEMREHIAPLRIYLQRHARLAHDELVARLKSDRYQTIISDWRQLLATMDFRRRPARYADQPVITIARKSIWKCYKKVINQGREINIDSPPEALHRLRKSCKKLRYLLESFQSLFGGKKMTGLIKRLKTLQQLLGEYQDLHFHSLMLAHFGREMHKEMDVSQLTDQALETLCSAFTEKQIILHEQVMAEFTGFSTAANYRQARALFKTK